MKKKRRKKRYGFLVCILTLFFVGGIALYVYGKSDTTTTATNVVTVGKVDVALAMATHNAGSIDPGDEIANRVAVKNIGDYSAYIRMFVKKYWVIRDNGATFTPEQMYTKYSDLSEDAIEILPEERWMKGQNSALYPGYDCYYYFKPVVGTKDRTANEILFSDSYKLKMGDGGISNELLIKFTEDGVQVEGYYEVIVEAIQADTCIPVETDINGKTMIIGWNDTPDASATMPPVSFDPAATPVGVVNFTSENTEITNANSFITMNNLVPGTSDGRVVEIKNTSNQKLPVYVYAESAEDYNSLRDEQKEWLEQLRLIVAKEDGTILYEDSLYKHDSTKPMLSKENPILIDNFPANTSENLYVAIHCPASWSKGDVEVKVNWIFASSKAIPTTTKRPSGGDPGIIATDAPLITVEPVLETEIPKITEAPATAVPKDTEPVVTDVPKETDRVKETEPPIVTEAPTAPVETGVVITDSPVYEGKETIVPVTKAPTIETPVQDIPTVTEYNPVATTKPTAKPVAKVTKEPTQKPKVTESPVPDYYLDGNNPADNVPRRTSTPKEDTTVKDVYPTKTGDATPIVVWLALFVVSCMGMCVTFTTYQRRR